MHFDSHSSSARAGHPAGQLRDFFAQAVHQWLHWGDDSAPVPTVEADGQEVPIDRVCALVWRCTDTMPRSLCENLEIEIGSSYAQGARHLRR
jgi:hypothetical protein